MFKVVNWLSLQNKFIKLVKLFIFKEVNWL